MKAFKADLHIHTLLSPCADLEMTPRNIVMQAKKAGLEIIGITDHNSTLHTKLVKKLAEKEKIFVLEGVEITTREEVHCLAFFRDSGNVKAFQDFINQHQTIIPNTDNKFGYQPVIDENEDILEMVDNYLPAALKVGISEVQDKVRKLNGIFIAAHVDRKANGIFSQLGFIPDNLKFDALGISKNASVHDVEKHFVLKNRVTFIRNSDAHFLYNVGECFSYFNIKKPGFEEIMMALKGEMGRFVDIYEDHC